MGRIRAVRKRDGDVVPFDRGKIADAIDGAYRSVGAGDRALAEELAEAVEHFFDEKFAQAASAASLGELEAATQRGAEAVPGIEDIQDVVETVLMEMGDRQVAKAYILYRQKRAVLRESRAAATGEGEAHAASGEPRPEVAEPGDGRRGPATSRWSKARIAAALIREADLDVELAEEIAARVEEKVLASGIRRISTSLIRELVDNELFERGFEVKLRQQAGIAIPKYNLEQVIFGTDSKEGFAYPKTPAEVREIVADRILYEYSLDEVHSQAIGDAHRDGRVFIHRLTDPIRVPRISWRIPLPLLEGGGGRIGAGRADGDRRRSSELPRPEGEGRERLHSPNFPFVDDLDGRRRARVPEAGSRPESYLDLGDFFRRLRHIARFVSEDVRLIGLPHLLRDPSSLARSEAELIDEVFARLCELAAGAGTDLRWVVELELDDSATPWLDGLLALTPQARDGFTLVLRATRFRPRRSLAARVAELYGSMKRVEFLPATTRSEGAGGPSGPSEPAGESDDEDRGRILVDVGKITVNLPRVAHRAAEDGRATPESELDAAIDLAVKGLLERRHFVSRLAGSRDAPLWGLLGRETGPGLSRPHSHGDCGEYVIGLVGLNECVRTACGHELHETAAAQELGAALLRQAGEKIAREGHVLGIRLRLEETLNRGPVRSFEEIDRRICAPRADASGAIVLSYTDGVRWHASAPVDPLERLGEVLALLGAVTPVGGVVEDMEPLL